MLMVFINYVVCLSAWLGLARVGLGYSILQLGRRRSRNAHVVLVQVATRQLEILALSFPSSLSLSAAWANICFAKPNYTRQQN